jgi:hypothetical protein
LITFQITAQIVMDLSGLKNISKASNNLAPVFKGPIEELVRNYLIAEFSTEGAEGGAKWAELAPLTLFLRNRPGHGVGGIGRDTDRMYQELISPRSTVVTKDSFTKTSSKPYFKWFVEGNTGPGARIQPARPVFTDFSALTEQAAIIINDYVATGGRIRGAGGRFVKNPK